MAIIDGNVHEEEQKILHTLLKGFHITDDEFQEVLKMNVNDAAEMIKSMSEDKKNALVIILTSIIEADNEIPEDEIKMLAGVAARCDIELFDEK